MPVHKWKIQFLILGIVNIFLVVANATGGGHAIAQFSGVTSGCHNPPELVISNGIIPTAEITITHPPDANFEVGNVEHNINWVATWDDSGMHMTNPGYYIYQNGEAVQSNFSMYGVDDEVSYAVRNLGVGNYNFTIIVWNGKGDNAQDTVWIVVTDPGNPGDLTWVAILVPCAGVVVLGGVYFRHNKHRREDLMIKE